MKKLLLIFVAMSFTSVGSAAPKRGMQSEPRPRSKASKEVSFDEILVQGKHHFSDEAVITVEQDKVLDALLEVRKDFKDRIRKSAKRN